MFVIDTNVAISANGRDTHSGLACQLRCIEFLQRITSSQDTVFIDGDGLIMEEYRGYLNYRGSPGVGDIFYKYLHDHMYGLSVVKILSLVRSVDESRGFEELPVNQFDKSDRVFLALAKAAGAEIVNALDTDWHESREFVLGLGVTTVQLCPEHACL